MRNTAMFDRFATPPPRNRGVSLRSEGSPIPPGDAEGCV